ncbi:MAG TPA: hypothetical protein VGR37_12865 [Longimicrobiaceae bacterium]|nr:hypothetical protein [Longimicrobiaceae bacterium]
MTERHPARRAPWGRPEAAAVAVSLVVHSLLLLGWERQERAVPLPPLRPAAPREEVVYLDLPPLPPVPPARPATGEPASSAGSHTPPHRAPIGQGNEPEPPKGTDSPAPEHAGSASPEAAPSAREAAEPPSRSGLRDPRLYVDGRALPSPTPRPAHERLQADAHAAILAHRDSTAEARSREVAARRTTVLGRRIPVLGNDTAFHHRGLQVMVTGRRIVTPEDGAAFQELEIENQERDRERERILRERIRATRQRKEAERSPGRQQ